MTQSPPDKELERSERAASMPDEVILHKIQIPEIGSMLTFVEPLKPDAEFLSADYINKATLADDLARVEEMMKLYTNPENYEGCGRHDPVVFENGDYGSTAKEALTIIRRLRGSQ